MLQMVFSQILKSYKSLPRKIIKTDKDLLKNGILET